MRRLAYTSLLIVILTMILAPVTYAQAVKIEFWHGLTGGEGPYLGAMIEQFNKEYGGKIEIETQVIPWTQLYDRLSRAMVTKRAPDLVLLNVRPRVPEYADRGTIMDLTPYLERLGISREDYLEVAWDAANFRGRQYAIPLDCYMAGMYYLVDDYIEVGLDPDVPPAGREDFLEYARKLTKYNAQGEIERSGFAVASQWYRQFDSIFVQNDGVWFNEDFTEARFNDEIGVESLQFIVDLIYKEKVSAPGIVDPTETMRAGKASMRWDGVWAVNPLKEFGLNFRAAALPAVGKHRGSYAGSHGFVLPVQAREDAAKVDAALTFVRWMTERSFEYAKAGQIPARKDVFFGDDFKTLENQFRIAEYWQYVDYGPNFPLASEALSQLGSAFEAAVLGVKSAPEALNEAAAHANEVLKR
ncbi:MAG: ABC transporter substrate-binding protein [Firmicutes bacterium]|jgi:multiple sugar transport system substrate-binding protein|nr:ABC transporter substrate-binding protein [Bacillota bacterium]